MLPVPSDTDAPGICTAVDPSVPSMSSCYQQQNPAHNLNYVNNNVTEANDNIHLKISLRLLLLLPRMLTEQLNKNTLYKIVYSYFNFLFNEPNFLLQDRPSP